jgi:deoxyribonuclease V
MKKNYSDLTKLQEEMRKLVIEKPLNTKIRFIAGADVSTEKFSKIGFGGIVVLDLENKLEIIDSSVVSDEIEIPYIPGLLGFREVPILLKAYSKLKVKPDLIIVDGQGKIHPRGFGLACHLGVELNCPTIGCAKSLLCGTFEQPLKIGGSKSPVIFKEEIVGYALTTKDNIKPIFISIGNLITLDEAVEIILKVTPKYRLPDPIREAHKIVNEKRKNYF